MLARNLLTRGLFTWKSPILRSAPKALGLRYDHHDVTALNQPRVYSLAQIQKPAPSFTGTALKDGQFHKVSLADYRGKYVVLLFYPLDFTFVCPTELLAFNKALGKFHELNAEVIAVSVDSHFTHLAFCNTSQSQGGLGTDMRLTLVSDIRKQISRDYGVLLEDAGIALRGLFIIDEKSILRQATINDLPIGRSVKETLRLIQALQFTDRHGEVCPADWTPGEDTIVPSVEGSRAYFSKL